MILYLIFFFDSFISCRKILVFLQKTVAIFSPSSPDLAFKLYLEIAVATDFIAHSTHQHFRSVSGDFTSIAYDFLTQAFLVYEDAISESTAQIRAIISIVGSLLSCRSFEKSDYEALVTKTAQYAAKLLKKPDQCHMVCLCSRLFFAGVEDVSKCSFVVVVSDSN
jgi:vacuolar protein sorting-associated protein 35